MSVYSETRTIHTITIDMPDNVLGKIEQGDEVEVQFRSRTAGGRTPRPIRLSYSWLRYLLWGEE